MNRNFNEDVIEQAALEWLREVGYKTLLGDTIAPGEMQLEIRINDHD